jgi:hypothetical protein
MRVITLNEAATRAGIVRRFLERLIAKGDGPAIVHISDRRRGVIDDDLDHWIMARRCPAPGTEADRAIVPWWLARKHHALRDQIGF